MKEELFKIIAVFGTKNKDSDVFEILQSKSSQEIQAILVDLLTMYFNDKNSSTLREHLVATLMDFNPMNEKIGYDGYKIVDMENDIRIYCEVKPRNVEREGKRKLDGGGNFTDYSWKKLERHRRENPTMLVSGFVEGKLIYIFSFDFNTPQFVERIKSQLERQFPNGDEVGKYLRSASFTFNAYRSSSNLSAKCFVSREQLEEYRRNLTRPIYEYLKSII